MRAAAALSEHPLATHAVGEVAGDVLERLDGPIDLLVAFVERSHTGAIEDIAAALSELLSPAVFIGATACGVLGRDVEVENRPALSVWAASGVDVTPVRLADGVEGSGLDAIAPDSTLVALADPFSSSVESLFDAVARRAPGVPIVGGCASAANAPGGNRLILDGAIHNDGVVGAVLGSSVPTMSVVSQGCRPIGSPVTVTGVAPPRPGSAPVITELASRPPMEVLKSLADGLDEHERALLGGGLHLGIVIDEHLSDFDRGDFLVRGVLGADPSSGAIAVGGRVEVGTTVQFHVRDASSATEDLADLLTGTDAHAALTFTCNGRGERLFGRPNHDAELIHDLSGSQATAGMFCAGEIGPIGGRNHLHGFTASTLLFTRSHD